MEKHKSVDFFHGLLYSEKAVFAAFSHAKGRKKDE